MVFSHPLNSKTNALVLLLKTVLPHWNCFLPSVATDGKDENGLKFQKFGPFFSSFDVTSLKLTTIIFMVSSSWQSSFDIFLIVLQEHFMYVYRHWVMILAQIWPKRARDVTPFTTEQMCYVMEQPSRKDWKSEIVIHGFLKKTVCLYCSWFTVMHWHILFWISGIHIIKYAPLGKQLVL